MTYVAYLFPGALFTESEVKEVKKRNPEQIKARLPKGAFAFYFYNQTSKDVTVDGEKQTVYGKQKKKSGIYYPDGETFTVEQVQKLKGDYSILVENMKYNDLIKVVRTRMGNFQSFEDVDRII